MTVFRLKDSTSMLRIRIRSWVKEPRNKEANPNFPTKFHNIQVDLTLTSSNNILT